MFTPFARRSLLTTLLLAGLSAFGIQTSVGSPYRVAWQTQPGKPTHDLSHDVAVDGLGGVYLATTFEDPISDRTLNYNAGLSRYDGEGNLLWSRSVDDRNSELAYAIAADPLGNAYVAGLTDVVLAGEVVSRERQAFIRKYNPDGDLVWSQRLDRDDAIEVNDIDVSSAGSVYVSGTIRKRASDGLPGGDTDAYIARLDPAGELVWMSDVGTDDYDAGWAVSIDEAGSVFLSGSTRGVIGATNQGGSDPYVVKFDDQGRQLWATQIGSALSDQSYAVQSDGLGGAYIGGYASTTAFHGSGQIGAFVAHIDASGSLQWTAFDEAGPGGSVGSLAMGPNGTIYAAGNREGDAYVSRVSRQGVFEWTEQFGSPETDTALAVAVDASGAMFASGFTFGELAGPLVGGRGDAYLIKFVSTVPEPGSVGLIVGIVFGRGVLLSRRRLVR